MAILTLTHTHMRIHGCSKQTVDDEFEFCDRRVYLVWRQASCIESEEFPAYIFLGLGQLTAGAFVLAKAKNGGSGA